MDDFSDASRLYEFFHSRWNVSRETFERLQTYHELLLKWQSRINLISPSTIGSIWQRHIIDCAQLLPFLSSPGLSLGDIGSGAGFPGLILAILGVPKVHLIESDQRKAAFLKEAARVTETTVTIHVSRIETLSLDPLDAITARGCASISELLEFSWPFFQEKTFCLFLKGKNYTMEIEAARKRWQFSMESHPSITDPSGILLKLNQLTKKD